MSLDTARPEPRLDFADDKEVVQYRAISGLAIVACMLALASAAALISPLFWFMPPAAALIAWLALYRIRSRPAELTGAALALFALGLAIFFGAWAPARHFTRQQALFRQGDEFARQWFELVKSGRRYEAYELHLAPLSRHAANVALERYYENSTDAKKAFDEFFKRPPLAIVVEAGQGAEISHAANVAVTPDDELNTAHVVILDYELRGAGDHRAAVTPVRVFLRRRLPDTNGTAAWELYSLADPSQSTGT